MEKPKNKFYYDYNLLKEKLLVSLASNPKMLGESIEANAENIICQADEILNKLEEEEKIKRLKSNLND